MLAEMLYMRAAQRGDVQEAMRLAAQSAAEATRAGQTVQATRLLKKMSGAGRLYDVDRVVEKYQKDLDKRLKDKAPILRIPERLRKQLGGAKSQRHRLRGG